MTIFDSLHIAYLLIRLDRSQWWSRARIRQYQHEAVVKTLRHAANTVPYYRALGLKANTIMSISDIVRFPVLTRHEVQNLGYELLSAGYRRSELRHSLTSGTSGDPATTYFDKNCWLYSKYALKIHRMLGSGIGLFKRIVVISQRSPQFLQSNEQLAGSGFLFEQRFLSIHEPMDALVTILLGSRIDALYASPSYLNDFLNYCEARNISLPTIPVIFSSSEVLQDALRSRIESCLGGRVCDVYGSVEFKEVAWQCKHGTYHLNFESVYIESVPTESGGIGDGEDILITSLTNRAMPLIRYRIGDQCTLTDDSCCCGRNTPTLSRINGRVAEMVRLPQDERVSPYILTTVVMSYPEIAKYQIVQITLNDIEVRYVPKNQGLSSEDIRTIQSTFKKHLGDAMSIRVCAVPDIPHKTSGKHGIFVQAMES